MPLSPEPEIVSRIEEAAESLSVDWPVQHLYCAAERSVAQVEATIRQSHISSTLCPHRMLVYLEDLALPVEESRGAGCCLG